tara:strand:- start:6 stop:134 length:129 start_codon:yes stop_codon:yes gene_type:complete
VLEDKFITLFLGWNVIYCPPVEGSIGAGCGSGGGDDEREEYT